MPYISKDSRVRFMPLQYLTPGNVGELNYVLTKIIDNFVVAKSRLEAGGKLTYAILNDVMGVLASMQAEFYRRVAVPHEDDKRRDNGDVFSEHLSRR